MNSINRDIKLIHVKLRSILSNQLTRMTVVVTVRIDLLKYYNNSVTKNMGRTFQAQINPPPPPKKRAFVLSPKIRRHYRKKDSVCEYTYYFDISNEF